MLKALGELFFEEKKRYTLLNSYKTMRAYRKFCQRGSTFDNVFLVDEGIKDPNITINGPSSGPPAKGHLNGVSLVGR